MIIGNENLKDLFPEFEDCIKENGIDLKIGSVEHTTNRILDLSAVAAFAEQQQTLNV